MDRGLNYDCRALNLEIVTMRNSVVLRGFYQKVAMADQEQIVLAAAAGGNGN